MIIIVVGHGDSRDSHITVVSHCIAVGDDISHADEAKKIAARIQETAAQAIDLVEGEVFTSASIGIALSSVGYEWPQDILRDADTTLYRAKALGRSRYEVFEIGMRTQAEAVLQLEAELRQANHDAVAFIAALWTSTPRPTRRSSSMA